jgi:hypothetical protein
VQEIIVRKMEFKKTNKNFKNKKLSFICIKK